MILVGISGKRGAGKDTFRDLLIEELTKRKIHALRYSFADPLKKAAAAMFGFDEQLCYTLKGKEVQVPAARMTVREVLQHLGTECVKPFFGEDVWIRIAEEQVKQLEADVVVFADVRFPAEAKMFMHANRYLIRIEGDPTDVRKGLRDEDEHVSETALDNFSFPLGFFNSHGRLEEMRAKAVTMAEHIRVDMLVKDGIMRRRRWCIEGNFLHHHRS